MPFCYRFSHCKCVESNSGLDPTDVLSNLAITQGGGFSANGARLSLQVSRGSSELSAATRQTPRVVSFGLLHNGCPVQPPWATSFDYNSSNGLAYVYYGNKFVQANGYYFCVDLAEQFQSGKNESNTLYEIPQVRWLFDISTGNAALENESNPYPQISNSVPAVLSTSNNPSNVSAVQRWTSTGASVWTRRYRW